MSATMALDEFEKVLAAGPRLPDWIEVADVQYRSGALAFRFVEDVPRAYRYWESCAEAGHAGCMNVMADAMLTGAGGRASDPRAALSLHLRVFATGTRFACAGAFSALALADKPPDGGNPVAWIGRAYPLLDRLAEQGLGRDACDYNGFEIADFLMRLSAGERRDDLLRSARERTSDPLPRVLAAFLLGEADESTLVTAIASEREDVVRCDVHFRALWYLAITGEPQRARQHLSPMKALPSEVCAKPRVFAALLVGSP